jgi:hypothetical protein
VGGEIGLQRLDGGFDVAVLTTDRHGDVAWPPHHHTLNHRLPTVEYRFSHTIRPMKTTETRRHSGVNVESRVMNAEIGILTSAL